MAHQNIFQIYLTNDESQIVSLEIQRRMETVKNLFENAVYKLYTNQTLRQFIEEYYPGDVLETYDSLVPLAYRADLARYCLINTFGGWYVDIGIEGKVFKQKLEGVDKLDMIVFCDLAEYSQKTYSVFNGIFYSKPNSPVLMEAIKMIVKHCKENFYGSSPIEPTGPGVLGRAVASVGYDMKILTGYRRILTPMFMINNDAFVMFNGLILAYAKPTCGGDLKSLGCQGTNNYNELWRERRIYSKTD